MKQITHGLLLWLLVVGLISLTGCSFDPSINVSHKWQLKPGELKWYVEETEPGGQRRVNVSMEPFPKDSNVMVALVFKEDLDEAKAAMKKGEEPPKYLRSHPGGGSVKFEPTIIAKKQPFAVIVRNGVDESAEIVLKISAK
jgi:hypothetical protein